MTARRADALRNRARLIEAARDSARAHGRVPALNELARIAGVGVGTVYRHFPDRDALEEAVVEADLVWLAEEVEAAGTADPSTGVRRLVRAALVVSQRDGGIGRVLFRSHAEQPSTQAALSALTDGVDRVLERARRAGALRADIDTDDLRRLICGIDHAARAGGNPADAAERYAEIILAGLCAPGPGGQAAA